MTTVLVLLTVIFKKIYDDYSFGTLSTVVTAMLWIRVLSYLKVFNEQMALFVAAMGQIIVDARFFGVVLIVLIFMFADMMQILVTSKDDGEYCQMMQSIAEPLPAIIDFCSGSRSAALLRM
jgi:Polycystin cation channel